MQRAGHPAPLGDPATGVVILIEQPVGPRVLDALRASLSSIDLQDAYVTYAATGLLKEELLAAEPRLLVAIGPGAAQDLDALNYPLSRARFSDAQEGRPFDWTSATTGLLLPSLAPALDDDTVKRRFWRRFLTLRDFAVGSRTG